MKKIIASFLLVSAAALPAAVQARTLSLTTELQNYGGEGAYLAFYLTDANGKYQKTLWVAGKKSKYYKSLRDWARGSRLNPREFDGVSGASVGSGRSLTVKVELADALIDAGYEIRIDSAVEDGRENAVDVRVPLTATGAGKPVAGRGYVKSFKYDM